MNKKLLALLLVVPIGFFAADKVLGLNTHDGGGKEKHSKKTTVTSEAPVTQTTIEEVEVQEVQQEAENNAPAPVVEKKSGLEGFTAAERAELRRTVRELREIMDSEDAVAEYHSSNVIGSYDDALGKDVAAFLDKRVGDVLEEMDVFGLNLEDQFSRCGSGYHYNVIVDADNQPTNEGYMVRDQGCWDRPIAKFQYDYAARTVSVKISDAVSLSVRDFLTLVDEA